MTMTWLPILFLILLALILIGLVIAIVITLLFIFPMVRGAVYVPSKDSAIETMIKLAKLKPGKATADLGSGDGRVVLAFARHGAQADGFEINPWLVWKSRRILNKAGFAQKTQIYGQSYWDYDLSQYDVITVYGITYIMEALEKKLRKELKPGAIVISNYFEFPTWKPSKVVRNIRVYQA